MMKHTMMREVIVFMVLLLSIGALSKSVLVGGDASEGASSSTGSTTGPAGSSCYSSNNYYCLSWRTGVEAGNIRAWRTVPTQCLRHIQTYMMGGQYERDLNLVVDNIIAYINSSNVVTDLSDDGLDAWVLDVDDTCLSNIFYYQSKRFGCEPYDPVGFKIWASIGACRAIPAVLRLFHVLVDTGFKVFLITGRDEETLGRITLSNLHNQGFIGYQSLILRGAAYRGQSAVLYKSEMRKQLVGQGYRIWGNVGDQWSDLQGDCIGSRTFKLPNPMYFVP